jgi:C4-dicarboxylate transporter DctM subunit
LGGIMTGWFAPREAGVVAIVYILLVVIPLLNFAHLQQLPRDFAQAGLIYSLPLITIGAASAFGWMLAYLRGPIVVSGWIANIAGNDPYKIMFALVALFTIVGDFIEPIPCIVIFMPIVAALTEAGGINPVHMGVVLIVTLAFGLITPPYGLALLMASKFVGVGFSQALRASLSIYVVFFATIAACIFFAGCRAVAPETPLSGSSRLLQEPERRRLYLSLSAAIRSAYCRSVGCGPDERQRTPGRAQ